MSNKVIIRYRHKKGNLDRIAVSRTFLLSIDMAVTPPFKDVKPLRCHFPSTEAPPLAVLAAPRNLDAAVDMFFFCETFGGLLNKIIW